MQHGQQRIIEDRFPAFNPAWDSTTMLAWFSSFERLCGIVQQLQHEAADRKHAVAVIWVIITARNPWIITALRPLPAPSFHTRMADRIAVLLRLGRLSPRQIAAEVGCSRQYVYVVRSWRQ